MHIDATQGKTSERTPLKNAFDMNLSTVKAICQPKSGIDLCCKLCIFFIAFSSLRKFCKLKFEFIILGLLNSSLTFFLPFKFKIKEF